MIVVSVSFDNPIYPLFGTLYLLLSAFSTLQVALDVVVVVVGVLSSFEFGTVTPDPPALARNSKRDGERQAEKKRIRMLDKIEKKKMMMMMMMMINSRV